MCFRLFLSITGRLTSAIGPVSNGASIPRSVVPLVPLLCIALSGCAVQLHGNQSGSGKTASSAVAASASGSNVRVGFLSGQPVSPAAPGGHLSVSGGGGGVAAVLLVGAVVVDFLNSLGAVSPQVKPLDPDARISHTCSCYGWRPPRENKEVMNGGDDR